MNHFPDYRSSRLAGRLAITALCALGLLACAQSSRDVPIEVPPPPSLVDAPEAADRAATLASLRVIVQFNQPVAFREPAFVHTLEQQAQARMRYLTPVSGDTHVYSMELPADQDATPALARLSALPNVTRVELDQRVRSK